MLTTLCGRPDWEDSSRCAEHGTRAAEQQVVPAVGRASRDLHELANRSAAYAGLFSRAPYGKIVMQDQWQEAAANAYPRVYRALVALGASPEDASDALQDAFERGLRRSRSDARAIDRPDAWLFVVALRRWRTHRWRRRLFLPLDSVREQSITPAPGENAVVLIAELKRLPRRERRTVTTTKGPGLLIVASDPGSRIPKCGKVICEE